MQNLFLCHTFGKVIRYSYKARDPKTVAEKEFRHHYWAIANGIIDFGVRKQIIISDTIKRKRYIDNINKESYEKHFGNRTVFKNLGVNVDNDSGSVVGRELGKESATDSRKSTNHESPISERNGNDRGNGLKFSYAKKRKQC